MHIAHAGRPSRSNDAGDRQGSFTSAEGSCALVAPALAGGVAAGFQKRVRRLDHTAVQTYITYQVYIVPGFLA